jgi:FkbM family methyltransferase|tara:strand:- start:436 stop:1206 length:771 start_codon:yes stop_codon:yes gene_type:complete
MRIFNVKKIELMFKKLILSERQSLKRRSLRFYNKPVEPEIRLLDKLVNNSCASIDIGVYRGVYTYHLEKLSSHVYAFEANTLIQSSLSKSFKGYNSITLENLAISSSTGTVNLKIPFRNSNLDYENPEEAYELGLATIHANNTLDSKDLYEIQVSKIRLDDYNFTHPIGFIKIDVEGHELDVVRGAKKLIELYKPNLLIEIEERHTSLPTIRIINEIKNLGYSCYIVNKKNYALILIDEKNIILYDNNNYIFIPIE